NLNELIALSTVGKVKTNNKDIDNVIETTIKEIVDKYSSNGAKVNREKRLKIVAELKQKGIFKMRGSIQLVASMLGVTRYTVYNDLERLNDK
ncbi:hypothetical protein H0E42_004666, partial [Salmonella enterica subsp. enterica serovar Oranienburg]|nr:hypothetical protein [Salmonella enterica subsp. enterica serovar Oranienburg]